MSSQFRKLQGSPVLEMASLVVGAPVVVVGALSVALALLSAALVTEPEPVPLTDVLELVLLALSLPGPSGAHPRARVRLNKLAARRCVSRMVGPRLRW